MNSMIHRNTLDELLTRTAARLPDKTALIWNGAHDTYAELDTLVSRCANAIAAQGIGKGDRVAMLAHNHREFAIVYFALVRLGAISVPINYMLAPTDVAYILHHCGATGLVVEDALVPTCEAALAQMETPPVIRLRGVIKTHEAPLAAGWQWCSTWFTHADAVRPQIEVADDDCLQLLYTSGTESRPKGTMQCSRNLIAEYVSCIVDGGYSEDDIEIHALPLYHSAQAHCFLGPDVMLGCTNIILPGADAATILRTIEAEHANKLFCPPTVWISLLRHPDFDRRDLSSLEKGYYGASIMPRPVIEELAQRLPKVRLYNYYGQTEIAPLATVLKPGDQMRKLGSAGRACLNVETRIVDDDDRSVPVGEIGEIVHRSPQVMLGYWDDPEKTAAAFRNDWFHSGDLAYADAEGFIFVVDRKKDMIKTGGENVASREVEEALFRHPAVAEVTVFGIPHPRWIEAVTAVVVPKAGQAVTAEEILTYGRERLSSYKAPKYAAIADSLPKNASGKILKRELRKQYAKLAE